MIQDQLAKALASLKKRNPAHPMIPVIESCDMPYLALEYAKLSLEDPIDVPAEEYTVNGLYKKKDHLYSRRAVLSNKFHDCTSDAERRQISIAIGSIQTDIIRYRRLLDEYHTTGRLPKAPVKDIIPSDGSARLRKVYSLRTSISRYRGLIRQTKDKEKIKEYESKIGDLSGQVEQLTA